MEYWDKIILLENLVKDGIIKLDRGRVISSVDIMKYPGDYPVYSSSAQKNGYFGSFDLYYFDEELITWSVDGGGYFFYRPKHKFSVTNVSGIMRIIEADEYDYKFLYYFLDYKHKNQVFDYVDKAHPSVIKKRYSIPVISLTEQTQIATILSKVDEAISQTEQLITKHTRIRIGLMEDLLSKGIDEYGNIRNEATHEFKESSLGRIPKEWELPILDELKEFITSGSRGWAKYYNVEGSQFIRITNLKRNQIEIDNTEMKFVKLPGSIEGMRSRLQKGDILISITADLGIIGVVPENFGDAFINQHIALVRLNRLDINPRFIGYFLCSQIGQSIFNRLNDGGAKAGLNLKTVGNISILKPSRIEQDLIVDRIESINNVITAFQTQLKKLQSLKTGLMQDLLSGKVRVNHLIKQNASA